MKEVSRLANQPLVLKTWLQNKRVSNLTPRKTMSAPKLFYTFLSLRREIKQ